jgi:hypothetical protein
MRRIKTFEQFRLTESLITEALPPSIAKEYTSIKRNESMQNRLNFIFDQLSSLPGAITSKRGDRVYIPFSYSGPMITQESPVKKEVETVLQGTDFKLKDYELGVAVDKYGRETKLGKVLAKIGNTDLVKKFNGDKTREGVTKTDFIIVFSKHPYDIAGMSTHRGWTSCMNLYDKELKKYVKTDNNQRISWDVKEGSFICYLVNPKDTNLNKPTGRILVKPYVNVKDKNDILYSPDQNIYGTAPEQFLTAVNDVLSDIQGEKVGKFKLSQELYCDTMSKVIKYPKNIQEFMDGKTKPKDKNDVEQILEALGVRGYTINSDLSVDVIGDVRINEKTIRTIPIQFRVVGGGFYCSRNQLTSLQGAPETVGGNFWCDGNKLTSLQGAPETIGGVFYCNNNRLISLQGAPETVGGDFWCDGNKLTSLQGAPETVGRDFMCNNNKLTSLQGAPREVGDSFLCDGNQLTSLQGAPREVGGRFSCGNNQLTSLQGAPREVGGRFACNNNQLTSLQGAPETIGGVFYCDGNQLISLQGAPETVGGSFFCSNNLLTSLQGAPQTIDGDFWCNNNQLTSLQGAPRVVGDSFSCQDNPNLPQSERDWAEKNVRARTFRW